MQKKSLIEVFENEKTGGVSVFLLIPLVFFLSIFSEQLRLSEFTRKLLSNWEVNSRNLWDALFSVIHTSAAIDMSNREYDALTFISLCIITSAIAILSKRSLSISKFYKGLDGLPNWQYIAGFIIPIATLSAYISAFLYLRAIEAIFSFYDLLVVLYISILTILSFVFSKPLLNARSSRVVRNRNLTPSQEEAYKKGLKIGRIGTLIAIVISYLLFARGGDQFFDFPYFRFMPIFIMFIGALFFLSFWFNWTGYAYILALVLCIKAVDRIAIYVSPVLDTASKIIEKKSSH